MHFHSFIGYRIIDRLLSFERYTFKLPLLFLSWMKRKSPTVPTNPFWCGLLSQAYGGPQRFETWHVLLDAHMNAKMADFGKEIFIVSYIHYV